MTNTSTSAQDAKMGGCTSATANNQNTITIEENLRDSMREVLFDIQMEGFWTYFRTQPIAMATLGRYIEHYAGNKQHTAECKSLTEFIESISQMNDYIYEIIESRRTLDKMDEVILSIPVVEDAK